MRLNPWSREAGIDTIFTSGQRPEQVREVLSSNAADMDPGFHTLRGCFETRQAVELSLNPVHYT